MSPCGCQARDETLLDSGCACDVPPFPPIVPIPAGLSMLPRQRLGFGEYTEHMLSQVRSFPALAGWQARAPGDLGAMLLESWAYVLDVTGFYDALIANESFIRTASRTASLRQLTALLGYRPRPAVASSVWLAAFAGGVDPLTVQAGTAFRGKAFDGEAPQIFELDAATEVHPARNGWEQAPVRPLMFEGYYAFDPAAAGAAAGQIAVVTMGGLPHTAVRVVSCRSQALSDGASYRVALFNPQPDATGHALSQIRIATYVQVVSTTPFTPSSGTAITADGIVLDALYPQIAINDLAVIEAADGSLRNVAVTNKTPVDVIVAGVSPNEVKTKVTKISFASLGTAPSVARIHVRRVDAGTLINAAQTEFAVDDLVGRLPLAAPVQFPQAMTLPSSLVAKGAGKAGARYAASPSPLPQGAAEVVASGLEAASAQTIAAPVIWHGNLLKASRGETVFNEVLGSGNSSIAHQTFRLRKKPLTYLPSTGAPSGIAPQLEVRVNGILWRRIDSFLAAKPGEQVFTIRHDDDGETDIMFGELSRPPTGNANITATYRHGAGAAAPPPGSLTQLAKRLPGLSKIVSALQPSGGADAESAGSLRDNAPATMMTTGRAVSVLDYRALAADYPGVVNAAASWAWDLAFQRATVLVWIISNGPSVAHDVAAHLAGSGDGETAIRVTEAVDEGATLAVGIEHHRDHDRTSVEAAVRDALIGEDNGLFAPSRVKLGEAFYRSVVSAAVMAVTGVRAVRSIHINGAPAPVAIAVSEGTYLAFDGVTIG